MVKPEELSTGSPEVEPTLPRRMAIFADGTGNAFRHQESNVWRLYESLEKSAGPEGPRQLARYMPGVGTSALGIVRMIDGATGFGVPANVRKLYRFLCWNWRPGDEIYLFGFSRGAFTVRTLAGMIRFQGLMPREVDGRLVTDAEMRRNVLRAWHGYRAQTAPLIKDGRLKMMPYIAAVRWLRDGVVNAKRRMLGQPTPAEVSAALPEERRPGAVKIKYMGLFDTVEAYGFPFEGLRDVWSWFLWPITFRNRECSRIVGRADQMLSLDDERLTFHPIRFDQSRMGSADAPTQIRELWFAGVHSDIGGGYPDDAAAMDPLVWVAEAASAEGLRLDPGAIADFRARRIPQSVIHDSRKGTAATYRYQPRPKQSGPEHGPVVLHASVLRKMEVGSDGYAPLGLPEDAQICPEGPLSWEKRTPIPLRQDRTREAEVQLRVRRRRWLNRALIACGVLFVALPLFPLLDAPAPGGFSARLVQMVKAWAGVAGLSLRPLWDLYAAVWPWAAAVAAAAALLAQKAEALRGEIRDHALHVWQQVTKTP